MPLAATHCPPVGVPVQLSTIPAMMPKRLWRPVIGHRGVPGRLSVARRSHPFRTWEFMSWSPFERRFRHWSDP